MKAVVLNEENIYGKKGQIILTFTKMKPEPNFPDSRVLDVPEALDGKIIKAVWTMKNADTWTFGEDIKEVQPVLAPHWNLNGEVLSEEPKKNIYRGPEGDFDVQPSGTFYVKGEEKLEAPPFIGGHWYLISDPTNTNEHSLECPQREVWQSKANPQDISLTNPNDENYVLVTLDDYNYTFLAEGLDESYVETVIFDTDYVLTEIVNPLAVHYEEDNDYRYLLTPEAWHYVLEEDAEATEAAAAQESLDKLQRIFDGCREKWRDITNKFAMENVFLGIQADGKTKEVADVFKEACYYVEVNAPLEAAKCIDLIQRDDKYLTEERLTAMKNEFLAFLAELSL